MDGEEAMLADAAAQQGDGASAGPSSGAGTSSDTSVNLEMDIVRRYAIGSKPGKKLFTHANIATHVPACLMLLAE